MVAVARLVILLPLALRLASSVAVEHDHWPRAPSAHAPAPEALHGVVSLQSLQNIIIPFCSVGRFAKVTLVIVGETGCAPEKR
jgi:hypothetical protein